MNERRAAARDLERIRALMERAGRYSNQSALSAFIAGGLAVAGAVLCWRMRVDFNRPYSEAPMIRIWGAVFVLALAQAVALTVVKARRRAEPVWSHVTQQVVIAMLPAAFMGAALTGFGVVAGRLDLLPPVWMLAYGTSLMGLGLFADWRIKLVGLLFLLFGAITLFWGREHGLRMMLPSFGGLHFLLGTLILWKPRASAD